MIVSFFYWDKQQVCLACLGRLGSVPDSYYAKYGQNISQVTSRYPKYVLDRLQMTDMAKLKAGIERSYDYDEVALAKEFNLGLERVKSEPAEGSKITIYWQNTQQ